MTATAFRFRGVGKSYPHFDLVDVDLELPEGGIMGFIGPNGAGKSTTLRILMGLVRQDRGEVEALGRAMPADEVAVKRDTGFASEDMRLYRQATLGWHMEFVRSIYPSWDEAYAETLVHRFGLQREQRLKGFSHGQRVKAGLLLVLARRPRLLVLDEPTTGLDPVARTEVLEELMEVLADEERSILFSSHNTLDVEQISDQIAFIDRGRIIESRDKESYLERWRRLRLELPVDGVLPELPRVARVKQSGRLATAIASDFHQGLVEAYGAAGATVTAVETMTLEEIFVATVQRSREGDAA